MTGAIDRRGFLAAAGAAMAAGAAEGQAAGAVEIVGISCSPRKGKNTARAVAACLEAAKGVDQRIAVGLIELADLSIPAQLAAGLPLRPGEKDDFPSLVPRLARPSVRGIIVGSPVYFGNMSALCKAFLDRCIAFRKQGFALSNKVAGVVAVGGARNGGQELVVQSIQAALMCQEMIIVGDARPSGRFGALLWSKGGDIANDPDGLKTAENLGKRVAQVALMLAAGR